MAVADYKTVTGHSINQINKTTSGSKKNWQTNESDFKINFPGFSSNTFWSIAERKEHARALAFLPFGEQPGTSVSIQLQLSVNQKVQEGFGLFAQIFHPDFFGRTIQWQNSPECISSKL